MGESLLMWGLVLLLAGVLVLILDIVVPSAGLLSVTAALLAVAGVVCLFRHDWRWGLAGTSAVLILGPLIFMFGLQVMPSTPLGRKLMFGESGEDQPVLKEDDGRLAELVGREGVCLTDLRPIGAVRIGDRRIDARSEVSFVRAGTAVRVTAISGHEVKVRPVV